MAELNSPEESPQSLSSEASSPRPSHQPRPSAESAPYSPSVARWTRQYCPDASIALLGIRGTGLSTLAVFAAGLLRFKLLDADHQFYQTTGLSRARFRSTHGINRYREAEIALLRSMLLNNPARTVIVCGPGAVEPTGRALLSEFGIDHPIIYVARDLQGIQDHLRTPGFNVVSSIYQASAPALRMVSNFEFFNSTHYHDDELGSSQGQGPKKTLALKHVEQNFSHFLQSVTKDHDASQGRLDHLQLLKLDRRQFTSALTLHAPVSDTFWALVRLEDVLADAMALIIPMSKLDLGSGIFDNSAAEFITREYYAAKNSIRIPIVLDISSVGHAPNESSYFEALHHGLRLGPDFLCVDLNCDKDLISRLIATKGRTRIIADYLETSSSTTGWDSPKWKQLVIQAEDLGADVIRLRRNATAFTDNFAVRHFVDQLTTSKATKIPIVAYNAGPLGQMSRYCGAHLNPVVDLRLKDTAIRNQTDHLLTTRQAQSALYSSLVLDTLYFGIYGNNAHRSLSPAMHNAAFDASGMPHTYKIFQHPTLDEMRVLLSDSRLGGLSITAPFKTEVLSLVDKVSHEAQLIGAINTLIPLRSSNDVLTSERNRAGPVLALYGDNTDWIGIKDCIQDNLSPVNAINPKTTALVLGAGGMARAATYALARLGVRQIFFHNRTVQRAEALVNEFEERHRLLVPEPIGLPGKSRQDAPPKMKVLAQKSGTWPDNAEHPTIVVSCIATQVIGGECSADTSLPSTWLASPTGGVVLEVRSRSINLRNSLTLTFS